MEAGIVNTVSFPKLKMLGVFLLITILLNELGYAGTYFLLSFYRTSEVGALVCCPLIFLLPLWFFFAVNPDKTRFYLLAFLVIALPMYHGPNPGMCVADGHWVLFEANFHLGTFICVLERDSFIPEFLFIPLWIFVQLSGTFFLARKIVRLLPGKKRVESVV